MPQKQLDDVLMTAKLHCNEAKTKKKKAKPLAVEKGKTLLL